MTIRRRIQYYFNRVFQFSQTPNLLQDLELYEHRCIFVQGFIAEIRYNGPFFEAIHEKRKIAFDLYIDCHKIHF
jgi:hypothetical protein